MSRLGRRGGDLLAFACGLALPLGFAPFGVWPAPLLALAVALQTWVARGPGVGFRRGWLFGLGAFGFGIGWVHVSMHDYGGASLPLAYAVSLLLAGFLALYPALCAAWVARTWQRDRRVWRVVVVLPAAWVLLEWVRGWLLTGFPWLELGYGQIDTPLAQLAPLGGSLLVTAAAVFSAGLLWALAAALPLGRVLAAALLALLWLGLAWLGPRDWTRPAGAPFTVAVVQGNVSQELKWQPGERDATLERYRALTEASADARLVVWPETAVPLFYDQVADGYLAELGEAARARGSDLLLGIPFRDPDSGAFYNGMLALSAPPGAYFKRHLVPFGEFLPLRPWLGSLLEFIQVPQGDFTPGPAEQPPLAVAGTEVGVTICYEVVFSREVRSALPRAGLLVNASNDGWFGRSIGPHQHLEIARMRALESGRYLLRATNTGISAIIGPHGELRARSPQFEVATLRGEVVPLAGATPYVAQGDAPLLAVCALLLLLGWLPPPRRL